MFLVETHECKHQPEFLTSSRAVLPCGGAQRGDIVFFTDMTCARVMAFFIISDVFFVEVYVLPRAADDDISLRSNAEDETCFKECRFMVDS